MVVVYRCLMLDGAGVGAGVVPASRKNSKQMLDPNGNSGEELGHKRDQVRSRIAPRDAGRAAVFAPPRGHLGEELHSDPGRGARSAIIFATWGDLEHYVHDNLSAIPTCQIRATRLGIVSEWACGDRRSVKNNPT